jgi:hypothetical protein
VPKESVRTRFRFSARAKVEQFEDNLMCLEVEIAPERMAKLEEISAIQAGFPHEFLASDFVQLRVLAGKKELLSGGLRG